MKSEINRVLDFWFEDCDPKYWFKKDTYFDNQLKRKFGDLVNDGILGYINNWRRSLEGSLAVIILTDQFTWNIFRGTPRSFSRDPPALETCIHCFLNLMLANKRKKGHTLY